MAKKKTFLGRGLHYPLQISASGGFKLDIDSVESVRSAVIFLLHTRFGERPHRPETGSRLLDFKHEINSLSLREALEREIRDLIANNEPRVDDLEVLVQTSGKDDREVLITINFIVIGENVQQNLVFPFMLA